MPKTQEEIIELVADLPLAERRELMERLEASGLLDETSPGMLELSDDERAQLERSREDFRSGRTMTLDEAEHATGKFLEALRSKS